MARVAEWVTIKRELYLHVYNQVQSRWGRIGNQIHIYRKKYDQANHRPWKISYREDLFEKINQARVVVLGDFHSLHQSQRSHLRILKNCQKEDFKIAVECICFQHQRFLDQYLMGELSVKEFLKKVNWRKNWGFPWEHYEEIFAFAKQHKIKMIALNDLKLMSFKDSLKKRDVVAARIITENLKNSSETIFIIYGELHLTSTSFFSFQKKHKSLKVVKIFQNIDEIYFQLMDQNKEDEIDVVKFDKNDFCLMNVPPWVKWQSYLMYLEKKYDSEIEFENPDYTDYVDQYIKIISKELGLEISTKNLSVYTSNDFSFLKRIKSELTENELLFYELLIEEEKSFYIPMLGVGYLGRLTINQAAALAMQYIYFEFLKIKKMPSVLPGDFVSLIWIEGICYFGSKIVNPKRKTETVQDIKKKVTQFGSKGADKEALKLALFQKTKELMRLSGRNHWKTKMTVSKKSSYIQCANLLGSIIGEKLYKGYRAQFISLKFFYNLMSKKVGSKSFENTYYELIELIENLPESFRSKSDKL